jgi:BMFP domain-containing protein YqiC
MQSQSPFLDELAKAMTGAMGAAQALGEEARAFARSQGERIVADMDLVGRDDFDAMREMAREATEKAALLEERIEVLEARIAALEAR